MKRKYIAFIFIIVILLFSTIATAGFWQDVTGMFSVSLSKLFKKKVTDTPIPTTSVRPFIKDYCLNSECNTLTNISFLIITRPLFVSNLSEFIKWKKETGFKVGILTVEWINENFAGENLGIKVRNALHSMKRTNGVKFVLLIGDTQVEGSGDEEDYISPFTQESILNSYILERPWNVPAMYYARLGSGTYATDTDDVMPSDLPYTTNYSWLEPPIANPRTSEINFVADIYVGRWPVRTTDELNNIVQKTINMHPIKKVVIIMDQSLYNPRREACLAWPPDSTQEVFCYLEMQNEIRARVLNGKIPYELILVNISNQTDAFNARDRILSIPNDTLLFESFHGSSTGIGIGESSIHNEDFEDFRYIFPLFHAISCNIGAYYLYGRDMFSEALIKSVRGPAIYAEIPNPYFFYLNLLAGKTVGESYYSGTNFYVYCANTHNLMGDPSLILYEPTPELRIPPNRIPFRSRLREIIR